MAMSNMHKDWPCSFRVMQADRQTKKLNTVLHTALGTK